MPSAATTFTNNNNNISKEKRTSVSSIGASSGNGGGGVGGVSGGCNNSNASNGEHSSNTNLADYAKSGAGVSGTSAAGSQTDLTNNNNVNAKTLKLAAAAAAASEGNNPMKQVLIAIEHKIRNLEKRKTKLESYRAIQAGGKEMSADQAAAVAKYESVLAALEFARDISKQTQVTFKEAEKEQKKQARKDNQAKAVAETIKIRELLVMQNVLTCFNDEQVRTDFLAGENGACKLETNELEALEKFFMDVQTRRPETTDDVSFLTTAQKAADLFSMTINARAKPYAEITFEKLRAIFQQIQDSGYLDKYYMMPMSEATGPGNGNDSGAVSGEGDALLNDGVVAGELDAQLTGASAHNSLEDGLDKLPSGELPELQQPERGQMMHESQHQRVPIEQTMVVQQQQQQQQQQPPPPTGYNAAPAAAVTGNTTPVHVLYAAAQPSGHVAPGQHAHQLLSSSPVNLQALHGVPPPQPQHAAPTQQQTQHFGPTTVRAVENNFFKPPQAPTPQQQQFMQQLRPLAEVLGTGSFHFLQDSELDAPESMPQQQAPPPQQLPVAGLVFEQQQQHNHVDEPQAITTLTFTNQSYPMQQQQQQQQQPPQQQLFSPVLLHDQQRQPQQQPMVIMARLPPQQQPPQQAPQQPPQGIGMQPGDVTAVFPYDSAVVSYEQQLQQQLGIKQPPQPQHDEQQQQQQQQSSVNDVENNDWHARNTNAAATAALTNVLKTQSSALAEQTDTTPTAPSNKWSSEMNAMSSAASNGSNGSNGKQDWATPRDNSGGRGGGYGNDNDSGNNHWNNSGNQQENGNRRNSGNYQRRNGGGDERGRNGGGNYRARQYGNSSSQQNGRNSSVYFRNNESSGGNNGYYQNGGGNGNGGYNKESRYESSGGNSYRGQRGGNQRNGRPMGDRGGGYMNQRQSQQQRMPLTLENKN
ncbi:Capr [Drosophila busckii]|uniref:Capr n=1 Tax=Drosophila busckii TaxID=30019 RepID=A0A0M4EQV1_DROBS|nr:Capr [Drosophila busckii]